MLKVRLMGTKNDIKWFGKILQRNPKIKVTEFSDLYPNKGYNEIPQSICGSQKKIEVTEFSDLYPNKGTKKFYRAYVEVKKTNVAES